MEKSSFDSENPTFPFGCGLGRMLRGQITCRDTTNKYVSRIEPIRGKPFVLANCFLRAHHNVSLHQICISLALTNRKPKRKKNNNHALYHRNTISRPKGGKHFTHS